MNKVIGILSLTLLMAFSSYAQQPMKFGNINSIEIIALMPETKAMEAELEADSNQKEDQLVTMQQELQNKQLEYQQTASTLTPAERAAKENELAEMSQKVQNYYLLAQQQIKAKQQELQAPIIQKFKAAVDEVGAEGGFLYIFDLASQVPVYHSKKNIDISPMVKAKLGIE